MKVVLVVALIAVAIYLVVRVIERRGVRRPRPTRPPQRPLGPDDDPDFLSGLN